MADNDKSTNSLSSFFSSFFSENHCVTVVVPYSFIICCCVLLFSVRTEAQDFGRRERMADILHYDIRISPQLETATLFGDVRITVRGLQDSLHTLSLDAVEMHIDSVTVNGVSSHFQYDSLILKVYFDDPLTYGDSAVLRVLYHCTPRKGMYFIRPDESFPDDPIQIWTQGQGEDNRYWLPGYDFPNDKATSELRVTIDSALITLSNGRLLSKEHDIDGMVSWHWVQDKPHSSYLIMFAAGEYGVRSEISSGVAIDSYYYLTDMPEDVFRTYATTPDMLEYFSDIIGVPYPWDKYAQIPVAHFLYGGMENTSATVLADTRTVVDARAALDYDPQPLIAHELAHQWWGNLVTYIDWNNEWLNEGFATYYQQRWTLHHNGKEDFAVQRYEGIRNYTDWADKEGRLPLVYHRRTSAANTYSKGAAVLHMLFDLLGEKQYRRAMQEYLRRFAYSNAETNDVKRVIEDVTGRNLHWFFSQWLYNAGYPELNVRSLWDKAEHALMLQVRQVQVIDTLCGRFRFPLNVHVIDKNGRLDTLRAEVLGADTTFRFPYSREPLRVEVDPDNIICGRIYVERSVGEMIRTLRASSSVTIRLRMISELTDSLKVNSEALHSLIEAARSDKHRAVRKAAAVACVGAVAYQANYTATLKKLFVELSQDSWSGVRAVAYNGLRLFHDVALRKVFLQGLRDSSYYVEAAAMNCLLDVDTTGGWEIIVDRLRSRTYADILTLNALDWVHRFPDKRLRAEVRALITPGRTLAVRAKAFETLLASGESPERLRELVENMLTEPRYQIRMYAVSALRVFGYDYALRSANRLLETETDPRVREHTFDLYFRVKDNTR